MNIRKFMKNSEKFLGDNSPAILTGIGIAGTVATAVLTAKATIHATNRVNGLALELHDLPSLKETIKLTWVLYIPPVLMGCATVTSIFFANRIGTRRAAALATAYTLSERAYSEYRDKIVEKLGEKKEQEARSEIATDQIRGNPNTTVVINNDTESMFYDQFSGRYFKSTMEEVKKAQNDTNYEILNMGYASLNEFYQRIGLPYTEAGEELGWTTDDKLSLEFSAVLNELSQPVCTFNFVKKPIRNYYRMG